MLLDFKVKDRLFHLVGMEIAEQNSCSWMIRILIDENHFNNIKFNSFQFEYIFIFHVYIYSGFFRCTSEKISIQMEFSFFIKFMYLPLTHYQKARIADKSMIFKIIVVSIIKSMTAKTQSYWYKLRFKL